MAKKQPATDATRAARELRKLDGDLLRLLERRQALASGVDRAVAGGDAERLASLLAKAKKATRAELLTPALRELLAAERQAGGTPLRVAYLGPENTFSHLAAVHRFGSSADLVGVGSIAAVFAEVDRSGDRGGDRGEGTLGVVPLENSTDGRVSDTLECFATTSARICGELPLRIHHCLLGSGPRGKVKVVCSKPQALSQCRNWLAQHLPKAEVRPVSSTADAAAMAKQDPTVAAIASERAAAQLELDVLAANIEDQKDNITRFAVIGPEPAPKSTGDDAIDKTALMFEAPHQPGSLADAMAIFKRQKLNLTWIESFPQRCSADGGDTRSQPAGQRYLFFVEFLGHQTSLHPRRAIAALEKKATRLTVLGSYPQTAPID